MPTFYEKSERHKGVSFLLWNNNWQDHVVAITLKCVTFCFDHFDNFLAISLPPENTVSNNLSQNAQHLHSSSSVL